MKKFLLVERWVYQVHYQQLVRLLLREWWMQSQSEQPRATRKNAAIEISSDRSVTTKNGEPLARRKSLKTLVAGGGIEPPTLGL